MQIREYKSEDLAALRAIHAAQGFDYALPDPGNPLFVTKLVLADDAEQTLGAALLRLTAEAYLLLDPRMRGPRQRWQALLALHEAARRDASVRGLEDVHAWLPPRIARTFGRRLERLGWVRDDAWTPYCKKLST